MKQRAFTLVEVLVALAILSVGLVPAFYHVTGAILLAGRIRDSLITANLAQEGIEIVRSIRDENWFNLDDYDDGLSIVCVNGCSVQHDSRSLRNEEGPLLLDPATGLYQYDNGDPTPYTRTITIVPSAGGLRVDSTVTWEYRRQQREFTVRAYLYDWLK
jgi:prepilin-type N-terminal cleavage/methylation domain-containing protein